MKILQVVNHFKPCWETGGVARAAYEISKALADEGHEVTVFTTYPTPLKYDLPLNKRIDMDGFHVYYFDNLRWFFPKSRVLQPVPYGMPFRLRKLINSFEIMHIHDHRTFMEVFCSLYAKKMNVPFIVQPHGSLPNDIGNRTLKCVFDAGIGTRILRNSDRVIAVSKVEVDQIKNFGVDASRISIIPNGISDEFSSETSMTRNNDFRAKFGIPAERRIIIYAGRLSKFKLVDVLVQAFSKVEPMIDNLHLVIAGADHGEENNLRRLVIALGLYGRVTFVGHLSDLRAAYAEADLLVNPAAAEIFGLAPFEALASGTKSIVVGEDTGLGEIVKENNLGWTTKTRDPDSLASTLIDALGDSSGAMAMSRNGMNYINQNLRWNKIIGRLSSLYEECIQHH